MSCEFKKDFVICGKTEKSDEWEKMIAELKARSEAEKTADTRGEENAE